MEIIKMSIPKTLSAGVPRRVFLGVIALFAALLTASFPQRAAGIDIVFDYSYDTGSFFGAAGSQQRTALDAAASFFEGIIGDDLDAIVPDPPNDTWNAIFFRPDNPSVNESLANITIAADTLLVFAGSQDKGFLGPLGEGGPGGLSGSGSGPWVNTLITRGEGGVITPFTTGDDTEIAPWGGSLSFNHNAGIDWNFSVASGPAPGEYDFYSTALHELGHVLGLSLADSFVHHISGTNFNGPESVASYGGPVPLYAVDDYHWDSGTSSNVYPGGSSQVALMDPGLTAGERRLATDLDVAALDDIGWDIVPEPGSALLVAFGGMVLMFRRPRRPVADQ